MKKLFLIWFALSAVFILVFSTNISIETYLNYVNSYMPNWNDFLADLNSAVRTLTTTTVSGSGFFEIILSALKYLGYILSAVFQILYLPVKFVWFVLQTIYAVIPFELLFAIGGA